MASVDDKILQVEAELVLVKAKLQTAEDANHEKMIVAYENTRAALENKAAALENKAAQLLALMPRPGKTQALLFILLGIILYCCRILIVFIIF
jgi:hypothetical protein